MVDSILFSRSAPEGEPLTLSRLLANDRFLAVKQRADGGSMISMKGSGVELAAVVIDGDRPVNEQKKLAETWSGQGVPFVLLLSTAEPDCLFWAYTLPGGQVIEIGAPPATKLLGKQLRQLLDRPAAFGVEPEKKKALSEGPVGKLAPNLREEAVGAAFAHYFREMSAEFHQPPKSLTAEAVRLMVNRLHSRGLEDIRRLSRDLTVRWRHQLLDRDSILEFLDGDNRGLRAARNPTSPLRGTIFSLLENSVSPPYSLEAFRQALYHLERMIISMALAHTDGNQTRAARSLGITRSTLQSRIKALAIDPAEHRRGKSRAAAAPFPIRRRSG